MIDDGLLSVVVIGRNEGPRLGRCLRSVLAMEPAGRRLELLYVDSGSTDGSLALAAALGARTLSVASARPTAALGRNAGWRAASGSIVLFLDGDTVLDPGFVAASLGSFADPEVSVVWGHRRELDPGCSVYGRVLDLDWMYPPGPAAFCGGDALMRRSVLEQTGGFDDTLIAGEEPELCRRILARGGCILHVDRAMTGHDLGITRWGQYWKRASRAGHAFAEVSARFRGSGAPFWEEESRRNRNQALLLLGSPVLAGMLALGLRSGWPLAAWAGLLAALVVRTAWKARWKSPSAATLLLYGLHSHLQQIPIFMGQLRFLRNRRGGRRAELVEYRQS